MACSEPTVDRVRRYGSRSSQLDATIAAITPVELDAAGVASAPADSDRAGAVIARAEIDAAGAARAEIDAAGGGPWVEHDIDGNIVACRTAAAVRLSARLAEGWSGELDAAGVG